MAEAAWMVLHGLGAALLGVVAAVLCFVAVRIEEIGPELDRKMQRLLERASVRCVDCGLGLSYAAMRCSRCRRARRRRGNHDEFGERLGDWREDRGGW